MLRMACERDFTSVIYDNIIIYLSKQLQPAVMYEHG